MKTILRMALLMAIALGITGTAVAGTIYKWTAADGTTSYGQLPPQGVNAVPVDGSPPAPSVSASPGTERADDAPSDDTPASGRQQISIDDEEGLAAACKTAHDNIAVLEDPDVLVRAGGAESRTLSPEERAARLQENRDFAEKWC